MTLNGVMALFCVISATLVAFSAQWLKVVEDIPKLSATEISPKASSFSDKLYYLWRYSQWITPSEGVKLRNSPVVRSYSGRMTLNLTSLQQIGAWLKRRNK